MTTFQEARAFLLRHRTDYDKAVKDDLVGLCGSSFETPRGARFLRMTAVIR